MSFDNNTAIKVDGISKIFQIYDNPQNRLKQAIYPKLQRVFRLDEHQYYNEFSALTDVSFEIKKGETVGIVGRNGSGKSTILQIVCGTLSQTTGSIKTNGRIAALLELGSGFNPEFTGRENVFMNAAILGLTKEETKKRFNSIVNFADIGAFIDQPVKSYSSGMVVRLAFAVSINVDPEILVVDEALSVGDEKFQRKCFSRLEELKKRGTTILFVSHSGPQVIELCDRAILMDYGEKLIEGNSKEVVGHYQRLLYATEEKSPYIRAEIVKLSNPPSQNTEKFDANNSNVAGFSDTKELNRGDYSSSSSFQESMEDYFDENLKPSSTIEYESNGAVISVPFIYSSDDRKVNNLIPRGKYVYKYKVRFTKSAENVRFGMLIKTLSGLELGGAHTANNSSSAIPSVQEGDIYDVEFTFNCNLTQGVYFMNAGAVGTIDGLETHLHRLLDVQMFRVLPDVDNLSTAIVDFGCISNIVSYE
ncbi:ABC transporter ATP-binding protein [Vibrio sp. 10N.261.46.E12]|uniref:ABC transporter ATP-binding protein n=1 Tax=unclassified Vibrio TaxID=2614977 RepID=UPI0009779B6B|nr:MULTISPECIES: ABC transporter ATP-binding protein [unclassified Vibrio]OMO32565.1 ABC transporter ATP-binding protein [Vibrio sp. 10N.261.45.E1]PMJ26043.1 ABC transporter ATP-binding protein [Vibrio sp. 10N.286.45.B6]PML89644.1 ABC transporter ATP-binding protein [Vibrio sp. 10N.261.49.E11]PMM69688.1 ABC transporter ATP-binding protein [Vibrio sp. 10N.261.46.F12]PMM90714.1 ABC transporter ATP-binding protein [Vibrio sp. 10N.261.46.E8]